MTPPFILSDTTLTIYLNGKPYTVHNSDAFWSDVIHAVKNQLWDKIPNLINRVAAVKDWLGENDGSLNMVDDTIVYNGEPLHNALTTRIISMTREGHSVKPLLNFLKNLMNNPSRRAIDELYTFLEVNQLPITEDGYFLAYKRINEDWTDVYSGRIDNSLGNVVEMPRWKVDDDKERTCSVGLHFASLEYLKHYTGSRLVAVKINPADVVSIPVDYNNSKGRCCRYQVVQELPGDLIYGDKDYWETVIVDVLGGCEDEYDEDEYDEDEYDKNKAAVLPFARASREQLMKHFNAYIPEGATAIAKDGDGEWYAYSDTPSFDPTDNTWSSLGDFDYVTNGDFYLGNYNLVLID